MLDPLEHHLLPVVRDHPIGAALAASTAFGIAVATSQGLGEGFGWGPFALFSMVAASTMFVFLVAAGAHLRLLGRRHRLPGAARRMADAAVVATASIPLTLAFRGALRPLTRLLPGAGVGHLLGVLLVVAVTAGCIALAVETLARAHAGPPSTERP